MFLFAKFFGLRISDYAYNKKINHYLKWEQVTIYTHNGKTAIKFTTKIGKHNQRNKLEILVWYCTCSSLDPKICLPCHMKIYLKLVLENFKDVNSKSPVFCWQSGKIITGKQVNDQIKFYCSLIGLPADEYMTSHAFRHGCITDLVRMGVARWLIKKFARHSPRSIMTFHYTHTTAEEEADMIIQFVNKHEKEPKQILPR